jgi:hypothetical protein
MRARYGRFRKPRFCAACYAEIAAGEIYSRPAFSRYLRAGEGVARFDRQMNFIHKTLIAP